MRTQHSGRSDPAPRRRGGSELCSALQPTAALRCHPARYARRHKDEPCRKRITPEDPTVGPIRFVGLSSQGPYSCTRSKR
jgi:hypothetical protein